jgi:hypothetical protein
MHVLVHDMAHEILHEIERLIFMRVNKPVTILFRAKTRNKSISGISPDQGMASHESVMGWSASFPI